MHLSKLMFWLAQANEPSSPVIYSMVVDASLTLAFARVIFFLSVKLFFAILHNRLVHTCSSKSNKPYMVTYKYRFSMLRCIYEL
jgi:hypothetical protein